MDIPSLAPGEPTVIGPYQVAGVLERRGLYREYLVRKPESPTNFCLRTLLFVEAADEETLERYRRECEVLTRLSHPCLPELLDWGFWQHASAYFVTRMLEGRAVTEVVADAPLPWRTVQPIVRQLLEGLTALHAAGIVHRNLTPGSLHLAADGSLRIVDFSLISLQAMQPLTATGTTIGDTQYVAPEQLLDAKRADVRADLYSVGVIAYQMLSAHLPRETWTAAQMSALMVRDQGTPLDHLVPGLSPAVYGWVSALTRPNRQERPATAADALASLPTG